MQAYFQRYFKIKLFSCLVVLLLTMPASVYADIEEKDETHQKVIICHVREGRTSRTAVVSRAILGVHLNHGDYEGRCKKEKKEKRLEINREESLRFGRFTTVSGGVITVDPSSNSRNSSGDIVLLDGYFGAAEYKITGEPNKQFSILLPVEVGINSNNGNKIMITNISSSPSLRGRLDLNGEKIVYVGGNFEVKQKNLRGEYNGRFDIRVEYID